MKEWLYTTNDDNSARYTLGVLGTNMIAWVGINPSTARPDDLDRTVNRVSNFSAGFGYDGWLMLNVYPQRATDPNDMHQKCAKELQKQHMQEVARTFQRFNIKTITAAWGTEIERRPYLLGCLQDMVQTVGFDKQWQHLHTLTKHGHPRHPLYVAGSAQLHQFDVRQYLQEWR